MPTRRRQNQVPSRVQPQPAAHRRPWLIEQERNRLFDEVTKLREVRGPSARMVETARVLLTQRWIKANWRTREELIKAADWLLHLESMGGAQSNA